MITRIDEHGRVVTPWWRREVTAAEALILFAFGFALGFVL